MKLESFIKLLNYFVIHGYLAGTGDLYRQTEVVKGAALKTPVSARDSMRSLGRENKVQVSFKS